MKIEVMERASLPNILQRLTSEQKSLINDQLLNNEVSDDNEIIQFFIEYGMSEEQAMAAVSLRPECLRNPLLHVFKP